MRHFHSFALGAAFAAATLTGCTDEPDTNSAEPSPSATESAPLTDEQEADQVLQSYEDAARTSWKAAAGSPERGLAVQQAMKAFAPAPESVVTTPRPNTYFARVCVIRGAVKLERTIYLSESSYQFSGSKPVTDCA